MSFLKRWAFLLLAPVAIIATPVAASDDQTYTSSDEPIIVTARKQPETLQDSPLAISVIDEDFLDLTGIIEIDRLADFVPGFSITPAATTRATGPKIRGISTFSFSDGFESSVATAIDGVVLGREAQGYFDLFDIATIEVIKGPQGTLFGANASAGLINIRTRDPEFDPNGFVKLRIGNFHERRIEGALTGPLTEKLALRISGIRNKREGYLENVIPFAKDLNDKDSFGGRAKALWLPTERLTLSLALDYAREDDRCCASTFRAAGSPTPIVALALNKHVIQLKQALQSGGITAGPDNRRVAVLDGSVRNLAFGYGGAVDITHASPYWTVNSISAWRGFSLDERKEPDGVLLSDVSNSLGSNSDAQQFSQELRVSSKALSDLDLIVGGYFFHQSLQATAFSSVELALPVLPYFNVLSSSETGVKRRSFALFAEGTRHLGDRTALIVGSRLSWNRIQANYQRTVDPINEALPFGPIFGNDLFGTQELSRTGYSGRIIVRHYLKESLTAYATLSRGHKPSGVDVALTVDRRAIETDGGLPTLPAEKTVLREIGIKGGLEKLTFGAAIFDQDLHDLQTIQTNNAGALNNLSIDRLASRGAEIDFEFDASKNKALIVTGSLAYLDIVIAEFAARPELEGRPFRDNARWSWSLTGTYGMKVGDRLDGMLRVEAAGRSAKNTSTNLEPFADLPAQATVNFRMGVTAAAKNFELLLSIENVLDDGSAQFVYGSPYRILDGSTSSQFLGPPRRFGISALQRF